MEPSGALRVRSRPASRGREAAKADTLELKFQEQSWRGLEPEPQGGDMAYHLSRHSSPAHRLVERGMRAGTGFREGSGVPGALPVVR